MFGESAGVVIATIMKLKAVHFSVFTLLFFCFLWLFKLFPLRDVYFPHLNIYIQPTEQIYFMCLLTVEL